VSPCALDAPLRAAMQALGTPVYDLPYGNLVGRCRLTLSNPR